MTGNKYASEGKNVTCRVTAIDDVITSPPKIYIVL